MEVTYDLAIVKIALQLQANGPDKFSKLFIHLGGFHIMLSYFKAIGKVIDDCWLSTIMVESGLLASGSVSSFIDGKHFNRCKRLHPLIAVGLQIVHIPRAWECANHPWYSSRTWKATFLSNTNFFYTWSAAQRFVYKVRYVWRKIVNGEFGKAAQFYMVYIQLVQHFPTLFGDFELFKNVLPKISN